MILADYTGGLHYHYKCVLEKTPKNTKDIMIDANDGNAFETYYSYYSRLEELIKKK